MPACLSGLIYPVPVLKLLAAFVFRQNLQGNGVVFAFGWASKNAVFSAVSLKNGFLIAGAVALKVNSYRQASDMTGENLNMN
jgi:hypothetical protein